MLGEHAVLHGKLAIVCAVNQRIRVSLSPRPDSQINITSDLGHFSTSLQDLGIHPPFRFVLSAVACYREHLAAGMDLEIASDFSSKVGLGSSAAVVAAMLAVLRSFCGQEIQEQVIFDQGLAIIQAIQGTGSGADLAASIFGGILAYRMQPLTIEKLPGQHPITVVYSGSKTSTVEVIRQVERSYQNHPEVFSSIYEAMEKCSQKAAEAIKSQDWSLVGQLLNINQGLMEAIGVSDQRLSEICYALRQQPGIFGAKISGSGLGDCVIGLGKMQRENFPYPVLPLEISSKGIIIE